MRYIYGPSGNVRRRWATMVAAAAALTAVSCSTATTPSGTPQGTPASANAAAPTGEGDPVKGGVLRVGLAAPLDGMNPVQARWTLDGNLVGSAIFDPLMRFDKDRKLVPNLAESVTPNDTGTEWTIKVRKNVKFHDGTMLDGEAVKLNIDQRKAQPLSGGALEPIDSTEVVDQFTTVVKMSTPWFGYDYTLAAQGGYMVAPSQIEKKADSMKHAVGTGPFRQVGDYADGATVKVERNPDYWGDAAYLDGIEFNFITEGTSRESSLKARTVDMIFTQEPGTIRQFRSTPGIEMVEDTKAEEGFAMLNFDRAPFDNAHARKALALATDREALIESLDSTGVRTPADGPFAEGDRYYSDDPGYPSTDLAAAQAEIELYKKDTGAPSLSFMLSGPPGEQQTMEALQQQWSAAGVEVQLEVIEQTSFLTKAFTANFQAAVFRNFAYVNPDSNFIFWHSSQAKGSAGSINFSQLKSAAVDEALETARSTNDEAARTTQYKAITKILNESIPYVWTYHNDWALAADEKVGGLTLPKELGFARQDSKPFWNKLWMAAS